VSIRRGVVIGVVAALALAVAAAIGLRLRSEVRRTLDSPRADTRPLQLVPLARPAFTPETWSGPEIEAVAFAGDALVTAGASGVRHERRGDITPGLPTRRASALAPWAGQLVVALEGGGLAVERGGTWSELRSGWGMLHARALLESPAGELFVGAREGLFRAPVAATAIERLDAHPVRALCLGPGFILAGGEQGLWRIEPTRAVPIGTPDAWIESVTLDGERVVAVSASGLAQGTREGPLQPVRGAETVAQAVWHEGRVFAVVDPPTQAVLVLDASGSLREEGLPAPVRRVMSASGLLFADSRDGLCRRDADGWRIVRPRAGALPPGSAHVTALARFHGRLVAGLFDGGLAAADVRGDGLEWHALPGTAAWGVNALLSAGGELWVASLRGAARYDGTTLRPIEGPGAAFSLAATRGGVAIGYGAGVLLPGGVLLSAFHGLPGNQAIALAESDLLYVGTPSGLGAIAGRRAVWRVTAGEGKLPHPWVTALVPEEEGLLVGTWGGGLVRRTGDGRADARAARSDEGRWEHFAETEGLQVSPGALVLVDGRAWAGTDAGGLWRQTGDRSRFERVRVALPSPRVTALFTEPGVLWIGTDQGVTRLPLDAARE
jgi:hypothetical protein